jgi:hypothetical protein
MLAGTAAIPAFASAEATYELPLTPDRIQSNFQNMWYLTGSQNSSGDEMPGEIPNEVLQNMTKIEVTMPERESEPGSPDGLVFVLGGFGDWWSQSDLIPWKNGKVTVTANDFPKKPADVYLIDEDNTGGYLVIVDGWWTATWAELGVTNITITYTTSGGGGNGGGNGGGTTNPLDTASDWAHNHITSGLAKGFIPSDVQANYRATITRSEFCRMAVLWVEYATGKKIDAVLADKGLSTDTGAFTDTSDPAILAAAALGITAGVGGGLFNPNGEFNREQAATMILNTLEALGADVDAPASTFADISAAAGWAVAGISFVQANGIMSGVGNNNFDPKATYTREQSVATFNQIDLAKFVEVEPVEIEDCDEDCEDECCKVIVIVDVEEPEEAGSFTLTTLKPARVVSNVQNYFYLVNSADAGGNPMFGEIPNYVMQRMTKIEITMPFYDPGLYAIIGSFGDWWVQSVDIPWSNGKVTINAGDFPKKPSDVFVFNGEDSGGFLVLIDGTWSVRWDDLGVTDITIHYGAK